MSVAKAYARALYESASEARVSSEEIRSYESQLKTFSDLINNSRELQIALLSGTTSPKEKEEVVAALSKKASFAPLLSNFLILLARKRRVDAVPAVLDAFIEVRLAAEGAVMGQLEAAEALAKADLDALTGAFERKLGKKVAFKTAIDENLLAGVKVTVSGVTYDGTLRSQLQRLRDRLVYGTEATH